MINAIVAIVCAVLAGMYFAYFIADEHIISLIAGLISLVLAIANIYAYGLPPR